MLLRRLNTLLLFIAISSLLVACGGKSNGSNNPVIKPIEDALESFYFIGNTPQSGQELWQTDGSEAGTLMVKEIGTRGNSRPQDFIKIGNELFFTADDGEHGRELWLQDVNGSRLVLDINSKPLSESISLNKPKLNQHILNKSSLNITQNSNITQLTAYKNALMFVAFDGMSTNLWRSDGSALGTQKIAGLGDLDANTIMLEHSDGYLYVLSAKQLWRTDGNVENTVLVNTSKKLGNAKNLISILDSLYFTAYDKSTSIGYELWKSDGTDAGTVAIDINPGKASSIDPNNSILLNLNGQLIFNAYKTSSSGVLWTSDGTLIGSRKLLDVEGNDVIISSVNLGLSKVMLKYDDKIYFTTPRPYSIWATDGSSTTLVTSKIYNPRLWAVANGLMFATDSVGNLWSSDGSDDGTVSLSLGFRVRQKNVLFPTDDALIFITDRGFRGKFGIWSTDGSIDGDFAIVKDIRNVADLYVDEQANIYFSYDNENSGVEPWMFEAATSEVSLLADINSSANSNTYIDSTAVVGDSLYFLVMDEQNHSQLWRTQGDEETTTLVKKSPDGEGMYDLKAAGDRVFFINYTEKQGAELWVSDGRPEGTRLFYESIAGEDDGDFSLIGQVGLNFYFTLNDRLWSSNGRRAGTQKIAEANAQSNLLSFNEQLYFTSSIDDTDGLWRYQTSLKSSERVVNPADTTFISSPLFKLNNKLIFVLNHKETNNEWWASDGTAEGTAIIKDIYPGNGRGVPDINDVVQLDNRVYFIGDNGEGGGKLWRTDGSAAGTVEVDTALQGGKPIYPSNLTLMNGSIYFIARSDSDYGTELWKVEDNNSGITLVKDITLGIVGSKISDLSAYKERLYFIIEDFSGKELWVSDGTSSGTNMLKDINSDPTQTGAYQLPSFF